MNEINAGHSDAVLQSAIQLNSAFSDRKIRAISRHSAIFCFASSHFSSSHGQYCALILLLNIIIIIIERIFPPHNKLIRFHLWSTIIYSAVIFICFSLSLSESTSSQMMS